MTRKGQARWVSDDDVQQQNRFIDKLSIWRPETSPPSSSRDLLRHFSKLQQFTIDPMF